MSKLNVVLCWHMHQPEYRDPQTQVYQQPWTYLHAIKDYVDMVAHLEAHPKARAVVNFVPILLEQLDDYAAQIRGWRRDATPLRDPLLGALADPGAFAEIDKREKLIRACLRANEQRLIERFAPYAELVEIAKDFLDTPHRLRYLSKDYLTDLVMWYHLAWMAETVRRDEVRVNQWMDQKRGFDARDREGMLALIGELLDGLFERYAVLAREGRVELSMTPYAHPIMPLLLDIPVMREAMPDAPLPADPHYPDGHERVIWHLEHGRAVFKRYFGIEPAGCWPSEGAISEATIRVLAEDGFEWVASGDTVLRNSLLRSDCDVGDCKHLPYRYDGQAPLLFFRDDGLSDLIGFQYQNWHADDAVADLVMHLETIAAHCQGKESVVSIIMDGENAWEHYPHNGYWLLDRLYKTLSDHPNIALRTYADILAQKPTPRKLAHIVAGSWVYGTLSTWIGEKDKNRGWEMLVEAKKAFDQQLESGRINGEQRQRAIRQLAICEGSDWFWWFGDYNPAEAVSDFERLFRLQLRRLYLLLELTPPDYLDEVFAHGGGDPALGGVMRKGQ